MKLEIRQECNLGSFDKHSSETRASKEASQTCLHFTNVQTFKKNNNNKRQQPPAKNKIGSLIWVWVDFLVYIYNVFQIPPQKQ